MKKILLICILYCFVACKKDKVLPNSDFTAKHVVFDGFFTNSVEKQEFRVGWATNFGDSIVPGIDHFSLQIKQGIHTIPFDLVDGNRLVSQYSFSGKADSTYIFQFCHHTNCYETEVVMPHQIIIEQVEVEFNSFYSNNGTVDIISMNLTSQRDQFFRYEIFELDFTSEQDTNWLKINQGIYKTQAIKNASNRIYVLNQSHNSRFDNLRAVKIKVYSLSDATAKYLMTLKEFIEGEFMASQYQNPPTFHDDGIYGLVYGTSVDSIVYFF